MMRALLARIGLQASRRLGWRGIAGCVLLLCAAATAAWTLQQARVLRAGAVDQARREREFAGQAGSARVPDSRERLGQGDTAFPDVSTSTLDLRAIFELARRDGVALDKGEFSLKADPRSPLLAWSGVLPVHGSYASVKRFAADLLNRVPHLAIDDLRFERPQAGVGLMEARLRFTCFYTRR